MIAAVAVLYHPNMDTLAKLIESVDNQVDRLFVIDNTPQGKIAAEYFAQFTAKISYHALGDNYGIAKAQNVGMTLAIEPMVNAGGPGVKVLNDGWTVITQDGSLSAHFEHTVLITEGEPEILTWPERMPSKLKVP